MTDSRRIHPSTVRHFDCGLVQHERLAARCTRECSQLELGQGDNQAAGGKIVGGPFIKAGCHGPKAFQAVDGSLNLVLFFVDFGIVFAGHYPVFLAWNHGYSSCLRDLDAHVVRIVGPVGQHGLPRPQVAAQQPGGLRAIAGLAPGQGQGANRP